MRLGSAAVMSMAPLGVLAPRRGYDQGFQGFETGTQSYRLAGMGEARGCPVTGVLLASCP